MAPDQWNNELFSFKILNDSLIKIGLSTKSENFQEKSLGVYPSDSIIASDVISEFNDKSLSANCI